MPHNIQYPYAKSLELTLSLRRANNPNLKHPHLQFHFHGKRDTGLHESKMSNIIFEQVARMAFGGMAPTTAMPVKTMRFLVGRQWNRETFDLGCDALLEDLPLPPGVPGAMVRYRRALTISFLFKAFLAVSRTSGLHPLPKDHESATEVMDDG